MRRLALAVGIFLSVPAFAFAGAKEDGKAIFDKFIEEFNSANADNVAKLFTTDALFGVHGQLI